MIIIMIMNWKLLEQIMKFNWLKYVGNMMDLGFLHISFFVVPDYLCCCCCVFTICYNAVARFTY